MLTALLYFNSFKNIRNVKNHYALRPNVDFLIILIYKCILQNIINPNSVQ